MRGHRILAGLAAIVIGCASGTSGPDPALSTFPADAMTTLETSTHAQVSVRTSPKQPPARGDSSVQLTVIGADHLPVDNLSIQATPWMPDHGHGTSVTPTVVPLGNGIYRIDHVFFFMAGKWELRLSLSGALSDKLAPVFEIL